ncbi:sensor histidine kinase [Thalassiella azotivora]
MSRPGRAAPRLATRLLVAMALVVLAGVLTAWLVAAVVGPPLFHEHLERAAREDGDVLLHAEEAFRSAAVLSFSVALLAALVAALVVSIYVTRRVGRSVDAVARVAQEVAGGRYDARVPAADLGPEFDALAGSFNEMAGRLGSVETTRRRLLSDLAHELRTPVATLDAYLEALEDGVVRLGPEAVAAMRDQTHRLATLARDVAAVSNAEEHLLSLELADVRVDDLVTRAVSVHRPAFAARHVDLAADVHEPLPPLRADPERLGQVLGNLLDNALRHTPAGGSVVVRAAPVGEGAEIAVRDTGTGIAAEHLPHVFERLYRADAARDRLHGGAGIGLAIVRAVVELHGGRVVAESLGEGRGTTVRVWLPVAPVGV